MFIQIDIEKRIVEVIKAIAMLNFVLCSSNIDPKTKLILFKWLFDEDHQNIKVRKVKNSKIWKSWKSNRMFFR